MLCSAGVEGERDKLTVVGCRTAERGRAAPFPCVLKVMLPMRQFLCPARLQHFPAGCAE